MSSNDAIIEFTIHVTSKASQETKDLISQLEQAKKTKTEQEQQAKKEDQTQEEPNQSKFSDTDPQDDIPIDEDNEILAGGDLKNYQTDPFFDEYSGASSKKLSKDAVDAINKIDKNGLSNLSSFAQNPSSMISNKLISLLTAAGPEGILLVTAFGAVLETPEVAQKFIQFLAQKGGPLNRDWHESITKEAYAGLSLENVRRFQLGLDQVIITQTRGYVPNNENWTWNSLYKVNASRIARIGQSDRAAGVVIS